MQSGAAPNPAIGALRALRVAVRSEYRMPPQNDIAVTVGTQIEGLIDVLSWRSGVAVGFVGFTCPGALAALWWDSGDDHREVPDRVDHHDYHG